MGDHGGANAGRRAIRDWPVQSRLLAVIVLALVMGLVFGGLRVVGAVSNAEQFGRASALARLGEQVVVLLQDLENERDQTAGVTAGANPAELRALIAVTNSQAAVVQRVASAIGPGFPANIASEAATVAADAGFLAPVRLTAQGFGPPTNVLENYSGPISDMIGLDDQIAQGISDPVLSEEVRTLTTLSHAQEEVSAQRALLYNTFTLGSFADGTQPALSTAIAQEQLEESAFQATAAPAENSAVTAVLSGSPASTAGNIEQFVLINGAPFTYLADLGITSSPAARWYQLMSAKLNGLQHVELGIARTIATRVGVLERGAQTNALLTGAASLAALLLVLGAAVAVARSVVRPLGRLRAGALEIATVDLPERVRRLGEADGDEASLEVVPIDVVSRDEIGQVARAFDQVHREAVRLAGNEAMLRGSFNATFLNLSRRSQVLIERLARQIDSLEQDEEHPERLADLFTMDHLVTRMRRNSENLLLLAGHEGSRRRSEAEPLADVARAAASEIEQYSRVQVRIGSGVSVAGQAASDIARLLAELIENATLFSPSESQVRVSARELATGGVIVEIADLGVGISAGRMAALNERLENPPVMDASVARHMGLFAVGRLAQRHGARVRLREGFPRGVTALVWLPDSVLERTAASAPAPAPARRPVPAPAFVPAPVPADPPGFAATPRPGSRWFQSQPGASGAVSTGARPAGVPAQAPPARGPAAPARVEQTAAGLPLRVPKANLMPGSAGSSPGPAPRQSPDRARSTLSGFQRGARRAKDGTPGAGQGGNR